MAHTPEEATGKTPPLQEAVDLGFGDYLRMRRILVYGENPQDVLAEKDDDE